jgi:hypothetical protein
MKKLVIVTLSALALVLVLLAVGVLLRWFPHQAYRVWVAAAYRGIVFLMALTFAVLLIALIYRSAFPIVKRIMQVIGVLVIIAVLAFGQFTFAFAVLFSGFIFIPSPNEVIIDVDNRQIVKEYGGWFSASDENIAYYAYNGWFFKGERLIVDEIERTIQQQKVNGYD